MTKKFTKQVKAAVLLINVIKMTPLIHLQKQLKY